jgi:hypothetical protein
VIILEVGTPKKFVKVGLKLGSSLSQPFKELGLQGCATVARPLNFLIIAIVTAVLMLQVFCYLAQKSPRQSY